MKNRFRLIAIDLDDTLLTERADYVTANNDEDGVAQVINKFVL